ncbi:AAA family ATPase [Thermoleophilia bacterium SCSIO 60948]|nr:AAA family ATPase [Thermoleophilia bacterium SCSIO 60948]
MELNPYADRDGPPSRFHILPAVPPAAQVRIRLCGSLAMDVGDRGDGADASFPGRQGRLLFAFLVLNRGARVSRDAMVDAVWGENPPANPEAGLATILSRLRRTLGADILPVRDLPEIELGDNAWVDVERARELEAEAREALAAGQAEAAAEAAREASAITAETFMAGFDADWIDAERARLSDLHLELLATRAEAALALGLFAEAERAAGELRALEPYRETNHARSMRILRAQGNIAAALLIYEEVRTLLRDELGTGPGAELRELHAALLAESPEELQADPTPPSPAPEPAPAATKPADGGSPLRLPPPIRVGADGPLSGRSVDLAAISAAAERAAELPHLVLVSGEPGIGKTRLISEFSSISHELGSDVLYGRTFEGDFVPYGAWIEALREMIAEADEELLAEWASSREESWLANLVPEIGRRIPAVRPTSARDAEADRYGLLEAVSSLLELSAVRRPLVICLEDLHWADASALGLLSHVIRLSRAPLCVVATTRPTGLATGHPLARTVAELDRSGQVSRVSLTGLDRSAIEELTSGLEEAGPELTDHLFEETAGNPFFLGGILRAGVGAGVPEDVRAAVEQRVAALGEDPAEVIRSASILGRSFGSALAERMLGGSDEAVARLDDALAAAESAGLLIEDPAMPGALTFTHALIPATLADGIGATRRRRLHARAAAAMLELEGGPSAVPAAEVASHLIASGSADPDLIVRMCRQAAEDATALLAHEDAAAQLGFAIEAIRDSRPELRLELLIERGDAENRAGNGERAEAIFLEVAEAARTAGDGELLATAALGYGGLGFGGVWWRRFGVPEPTQIELLRDAERLLDPGSSRRSEILGRLATEIYFVEPPPERMRLSAEALEIAERGEDERRLAYALSNRRIALWGPDHADEARAVSERMLAIGEALGDRTIEISALAWLIIDLLEAGDAAGCDRAIDRLDAVGRELGLPVYEWHLSQMRAMRSLMSDPLNLAEGICHGSFELGRALQPENAYQAYSSQLIMLRDFQGRLGEVEPMVRQLSEALAGAVPAWSAGHAATLIATGERDEAHAIYSGLASNLDAVPRDIGWNAAMAWLTKLAVEFEDRATAERLLAELGPRSGRIGVVASGTFSTGPFDAQVGRLAMLTGQVELAVERLSSARELCVRIGALNLQAAAEADLIAALGMRDADGDAARAAELRESVLVLARDHGLDAIAARVGTLA